MTTRATPVLEPRDAATFVSQSIARIPAYVPGWRPGATDPGAAVAQIYARDLKALADRVNQAPDKHKLAFLQLLGVELLPAQAARAPIVFTAMPYVGDSRVPERTRIGATVDGLSDPLIFETEHAIALASAKISQVVTLWPGRDAYADHSASALAGTPFTLFEPLTPVRHELYLAHASSLALAGKSIIEVRFDLATPGSPALAPVWEYWDGVAWRSFKDFKSAKDATSTDSLDATRGLTRSGIVRLVADCTETADLAIDGISSRWIRARLDDPLLPSDGFRLPEVARIDLTVVVDRQLPSKACGSLGDAVGIVPDSAYAGAEKLDLTAAIKPMGSAPQIGMAFYIQCDEAFSRPGAEVTLCFRKVLTPEEKADQQNADLELDVAVAQKLVIDAAIDEANALLKIAQSFTDMTQGSLFPLDLSTLTTAVKTARDNLATQGIAGISALADATQALVIALNAAQFAVDLASTVWSLDPVAFALLAPATVFADFMDFKNSFEVKVAQAFADVATGATDIEASLDNLKKLTPFSAAMAAGAKLPFMDDPQVEWEYWNGSSWRSLSVSGTAKAVSFRGDGPVTFTIPDDIDSVEHLTIKAPWIRARLVHGGYGIVRVVSWKDEASGKINFFPIIETRPPKVDRVQLGYLQRGPRVAPEHCRTYNDFAYVDHDDDVGTAGTTFQPFSMVADTTPALYVGFDKPLPADQIGLFFDIEEVLGDSDGPELVWEAWDGESWVPVLVSDETHALALPGAAPVLWPGGTALLPRFETPAAWLRARLFADGDPRLSVVDGIYLNAVWASQLETRENETLGSSTGEPKQVFFFRNVPVLEGETIAIRELSGDRARVEEPILRGELTAAGVAASDIRSVTDPRTGNVTEVWVTWHAVPNLSFAAPGARVYALERSQGRLLFGDGDRGLAPPAGTDNIVATSYRTGGGTIGNVGRGTISKLLAGVLAQNVTNVRAAEGGADGQPIDDVLVRGPAIVRHRRQAITASDYEDLARDASPGVAVARALPTRDWGGRFAPGYVTVLIVPRSNDARPVASFELRQRVQRFLTARAPAAIASHIAVLPAPYFPVGISASISPLDADNAGPIVTAVSSALTGFLHPLTGGPDGTGWPFGRDIFLSDVAAIVEGTDGVDFASSLSLLVNGTPVGESVAVPQDRIVAADVVRVTIYGGGG